MQIVHVMDPIRVCMVWWHFCPKCMTKFCASSGSYIASQTFIFGGDHLLLKGWWFPKGFWKIHNLKYFSANSNLLRFTWNLDDFIKENLSKPIVISLKNLTFSITFFTNFELSKIYFKIRIFQNPLGILHPFSKRWSPPNMEVWEAI